MSFIRPIELFLFIFLSILNVKGQAASTDSKANVHELIGATELSSIDKVYRVILKNKIQSRINGSCSGKPECIKKWKDLESQLLKDEPAQVSKGRDRLEQILMARYNKEQLAWLNKVYQTPLMEDFRKFIASPESSGPEMEMIRFLNGKIKQADAVVAAPSVK